MTRVAMYFRQSTLLALTEALLVTVGGFMLVKLLAPPVTMSDTELVVGPIAVALMWLGTRQTNNA